MDKQTVICIHTRNSTKPQKETADTHNNMVESVKDANELMVSLIPLNDVLEQALSSHIRAVVASGWVRVRR